MSDSLSDRLRHARGLVDGLTARELDRLADIAQGYTSMIESGVRPVPGVGTAQALARALGVSLDWLISGSGKQPSARSVRAAVDAARDGYAARISAA